MAVDERVLDALGRIYDAAIDDRGWEVALEQVCKITGAVGFNLFMLDHQTGAVPLSISTGIPDDLLSDYEAHYVKTDPGIAYYTRNPNEPFYYNYLHTPEEKIDASEYYAWLQANGGARYYLAKTFKLDERFSVIATAQRDSKAGHAQSEDMELLALLGPHLQRAIEINRLVGHTNLQADSAYDALQRLPYGVFLVDTAGDVMFVNEMGSKLISNDDGLSLTLRRLSVGNASENRKLQMAIGKAIQASQGRIVDSGVTMSITRNSEQRPYVLQVVPLVPKLRIFTAKQPAAIVVVGDPERRLRIKADQLHEVFGLTETEAEIAILLAEGRKPSDICLQRNISMNTLKTHRRRLYEKLGVTSQSELAHVMSSV